MSTFELWLGIEVGRQTACTIFGRIEMQVRPNVGERISFHQSKGSDLEFQVEWPEVGWTRQSSVSVEVEEVSHYGVQTKQGVQFTSVIRTVPLNVRSVEDAISVRDILTKQLGFEVDPYGTNTLGG